MIHVHKIKFKYILRYINNSFNENVYLHYYILYHLDFVKLGKYAYVCKQKDIVFDFVYVIIVSIV